MVALRSGNAVKNAVQSIPGARATKSFLELPFEDSTKKKLLWDNYARLYDLPDPGPMIVEER